MFDTYHTFSLYTTSLPLSPHSTIACFLQVKNYAAVYLVDISEVSDFNKMYELYDPCTVMFFYRNKHIMIDLGTGNNNKINWALEDSQEMVDIVETVYRGASKGRGLVVSPKDYSTKYRYWLFSPSVSVHHYNFSYLNCELINPCVCYIFIICRTNLHPLREENVKTLVKFGLNVDKDAVDKIESPSPPTLITQYTHHSREREIDS